jgi:resolvase-like protein
VVGGSLRGTVLPPRKNFGAMFSCLNQSHFFPKQITCGECNFSKPDNARLTSPSRAAWRTEISWGSSVRSTAPSGVAAHCRSTSLTRRAGVRAHDTLIVWNLDRVARSMKQLIETIEKLRVKGINFHSLTDALDHYDRARLACFSYVWSVGGIRAKPDRERTQAGLAAPRRVGGDNPSVILKFRVNARKPCAKSGQASDLG